MPVHLVGKAEPSRPSIAGGDGKTGHRHQPCDDPVDFAQQDLEVAGVVRGFRDGVGRKLNCLCVPQLGDVACDPDPQLVPFGPAGGPHDVHPATVAADIPILETDARAPGHDLPGFFLGSCAVFRRDEVEQALADELLRPVTEHPLAGGIRIHNAPAGVDEKDRVEQQVHEVGPAVLS